MGWNQLIYIHLKLRIEIKHTFCCDKFLHDRWRHKIDLGGMESFDLHTYICIYLITRSYTPELTLGLNSLRSLVSVELIFSRFLE